PAASCPRRCAAATGSPIPRRGPGSAAGAPRRPPPWTGPPPPWRSARRSAGRPWRDDAAPARPPRVRPRRAVPGPVHGPARARRPARGGGRPPSAASPARLRGGHLPLVVRRPAAALVVARPAHRVRHRGRAPLQPLPAPAPPFGLDGGGGPALRR